jgi:uncharacterized membrane protein YphA (DoxX/SURF4 family)
VCIAAFGVLHFVYPAFAPGIPPMSLDIPFPIPGHSFWVYLTAIAFLAASVCIAIDKATRPVAMLLGVTIVVFDLLTWVPVFVAHPVQLTGNWLKDVGIAGGVFILAESQTRKAAASGSR